MGDAKTKSEVEANAAKLFTELDDGKKGFVSVSVVQDLINEDDGKTIGKAIQKEALGLIKTLGQKNKGKISKMEWTTIFGSIFEKMKSTKKPTATSVAK